MEPVTQLYVSIDASTQDSLKVPSSSLLPVTRILLLTRFASALQAVDRPLFKDFWSRFLECLSTVATHSQRTRTVYRLTLVKSMNMDEIKEYAALVVRGRPIFIEIKGVTFCGTNNASHLVSGTEGVGSESWSGLNVGVAICVMYVIRPCKTCRFTKKCAISRSLSAHIWTATMSWRVSTPTAVVC